MNPPTLTLETNSDEHVASETLSHVLTESARSPKRAPRMSQARPRQRGEGRIFQRGTRWWIAYYAPKDGRRVEHRESGGESEDEAKKLLKRRMDELAAHRLGARRFQGPQQERVTVSQLLDALEQDYALKELASLRRLKSHLKHIRAFFGSDRAIEVTASRVRAYMGKRQQEGAANATINREVEGLQRTFSLAVENEVPMQKPYFPSLPEHNARQGFFERADFEAVLAHIQVRGKPDTDLRDYLTWFYFTGMRPGETKALTWADFDQETWTLRLHARDAKNRHGRAIPLEGELRAVLERRVAARRLDCPFIFHRHGKPMGEFRKVWRKACSAAGLTGKITYDFRRSAVRNMIRAGVNPDVARKISGHLTSSIFSRYNIISEADLRDAVRRTGEYVASLPTKGTVHVLRPQAVSHLNAEHGQNTDRMGIFTEW